MESVERIVDYKTVAAGAVVALLALYGLAELTAYPRQPAPAGGAASTPLGWPPEEVEASSTYIQVVDSCGPYFEGACVNARSGPGEEYPVITRLRAGVVLKSSETVAGGGRIWHKIAFDEWLRYPERAQDDLYVAAEYVSAFTDRGVLELPAGERPSSAKRILVDRSDQMLYAYEGDALFMQEPISTGIELTPTPRGNFVVFKKTPSRYMQGPIPGISEKEYDLPGVPWNLYFTEQGAVIHGAYWHDHFGVPWSSGCVNLPSAKAEMLYRWADLGTAITVRD